MVKRLSKFKIYNINFNYLLAAFVSTLNIGMRRRLRFIKIVKTKLAIRLLRILYQEGVIRTFVIQNDKDLILVYFKYYESRQICASISIVSKPSKRIYFGVMKLQKFIMISHLPDFILYPLLKDSLHQIIAY